MRVFIKIQRHPKYTKYSHRERISPPLGGLGGKNKESLGVGGQEQIESGGWGARTKRAPVLEGRKNEVL
jgi:hypothetical protein